MCAAVAARRSLPTAGGYRKNRALASRAAQTGGGKSASRADSTAASGIAGIDNYSGWYQDVIRDAEMVQHGPIRGTMVLRPYGFAIWEQLQGQLDSRLKAKGYENMYLPSLIPASFLGKEAQHVKGFAPEVATITHAGGGELAEPAVVRPTSETLVNWCALDPHGWHHRPPWPFSSRSSTVTPNPG